MRWWPGSRSERHLDTRADVEQPFTKFDQAWLMKFLEHRIADKRALRLIQKWLAAGVVSDAKAQHENQTDLSKPKVY